MRWIAILIVSFAAVTAAAQEPTRIGQYFCYHTNTAGILKRDGQPDLATKINLPENRSKFFATIKRVERNTFATTSCAMTLREAADALQKGTPPSERANSNLEYCIRPFELTIKHADEETGLRYTGVGPYVFTSALPMETFNLYGNNSFARVQHFDSGTLALSEGHCERIVAPK